LYLYGLVFSKHLLQVRVVATCGANLCPSWEKFDFKVANKLRPQKAGAEIYEPAFDLHSCCDRERERRNEIAFWL